MGLRKIGIAVVLASAIGGGTWAAVATGTPSIRVRVEGRPISVGADATAEEAARRFGIAPRAGSLFDVAGGLLHADRFPGRLLVNGRPVPGGRVLHDGDRLTARDGIDRTERVVRRVEPASLRRPPSPQYYVELLPGGSVVTRGAVSHRLVSARFVPSGPAVPDRAVALTFDDGPSAYTARIVALLRRLEVPATFFVVGTEVEARPELVRLEVDAGMVVGNHSYDHPWRTPFAGLPDAEVRAEIDRGQDVLERLGMRTVLFRPPGGTVSRFVLRSAARRGLRVVLWSVDSRDWVAGTTAPEIVQRVLGSVRAGSIVVMHDGGGNREATLEALPAIVDGVRRRGLALVALAPVG